MTRAPSPRHQWSSKKLKRQLEDSFEAGGELGSDLFKREMLEVSTVASVPGRTRIS